MSDNFGDDAPGSVHAETPCPVCGTNVPDWNQFCPKCMHGLRSAEEATRAELSHITYLQARVAAWQNSSILSSLAADRVRGEVENRRRSLLSSIRPSASAPPPFAPIVPPLPATPTPTAPLWGTAGPQVSGPLPAGAAKTAPNTPNANPPISPTVPMRRASQGARPSKPDDTAFKDFMQTHGLKLVFALATLLVVYALRSIIAWQEVGAVAIRLVPAALIGMTIMFWAFGQRTREENPWAGFVYHGMAAMLVSFDLAAMNRYWLGAAGASLPLKPALLLSCLAGTVTAGALLTRCRQVPYLHLFQTGLLATLYAALQFLRLLLWHQKDFHAAPLGLFGAAFLLLAALNFILARRSGPRSTASSVEASAERETIRSQATTSSPNTVGGGDFSAAPASGDWAAGFTLWAHLAAAAVIILSSLNVMLQDQMHLYDFAALALLGGIIYAVGAQLLADRRMIFVSGGLMAASLLFWLADSYALLWNRFGFLLMAISAAELALAAYNEKGAGRQAVSLELASAWRSMARVGIFAATALAGFQILARWQGATEHGVPLDQTVTGLSEAVLAGVLLLVLARWEDRPDSLYGALLAGGFALMSALEAVGAPMGAYALLFMLYGWMLYGISRLVEFRRRAGHRLEGAHSRTSPLPGQQPLSRGSAWLDETALARGAHFAAGLGLLIAALLPVHGLLAVWAWTTATFVLGCALYAVTAQREESPTAIYASLVCLAYASGLVVWRVSPHNVCIADILAPYALGTALLALLLSRRSAFGMAPPDSGIHAPPDSSVVQPIVSPWERWREPLAVMSSLAVLASLINGLVALLTVTTIPHPVLSLLPACVAALLLAAGRREAGQDTLRSFSLVMLNIAVALEVAFVSGLHRDMERWQVLNIQNACVGWILQGWVFWCLGRLFYRHPDAAAWSSDLTSNAMAAGLLAAAMMTLAGIGPSAPLGLFSLLFVMTGAFCLMYLQTWMTKGTASRVLSLFIVLLAAAAFTVHGPSADAGRTMFGLTPASVSPVVAPMMTVFFVLAACAYFALAFKQHEPTFTSMALLPLALGYSLFAAWKGSGAIHLVDRRLCEGIWLLTGIGAGLAYLKSARVRNQSGFATLSAVVLMLVYCHAVTIVGHPAPQWHALVLLPFLLACYGYGAYSEATEEFIGMPFRSVALAASGIALFWSTIHGDVLGTLRGESPSHALITWTLFAYGTAYSALALYRRTPTIVGVGSTTLTAAYLHALLAQTGLLDTQGGSHLSWPRFSCLAIMAGYVWLGSAWLLQRRLNRKDLAHPLLALTGALAGFCSCIAFFSHEAPGQADWSLLTLGCASILWAGMWVLEAGEICWHICAWNLLAAWMIFIPVHLGMEHAKTDITLLPFGVYLLLIGHRSSSRGHHELARRVWWIGLLLIMSPAFVLYWTNSPGRHEVVLIIECAVITLLGVIRRIRAYVSAGLAFAALLTAASIIGRLPYYAGTLLALAIGVSLFVGGFYSLTHRETIQRWLSRISTQWQAWQAWR